MSLLPHINLFKKYIPVFLFSLTTFSFGQNSSLLAKAPIDITQTELWNYLSSNDSLMKEYGYITQLNFYKILYQSDSLKIDGWIIEPKETGKYPAIIFNRGGNRDFQKLTPDLLFFSTGALAKEGYVILACNYRTADEYGGKDLQDVLGLIQVIDELPNTDTTKIGMFGWSRGGMMTYMALKESNRIQTAVVGNSPTNLFSSIQYRPELELEVLSKCIPNYWKNKDLELTKRSAIFWADHLPKTSSLLVICGNQDAQVNYLESVTMAEKLKEINYRYELKIFEANHGFQGKRDELNRELIHWFHSYLKTTDEVPDTTKFRDSTYYNMAIDYYKQGILQNPASAHPYYQTACYYALLKYADSAFFYLTKAIQLGAAGEDVITDSDFLSLREKPEDWDKMIDLINQQFLHHNPGISKPELAFELYLMWVEDQRWRTLSKNYKLKEKPATVSLDGHNNRVKRLNEIIKESGWPKYSEVGKTAGDAAFFVFQHHYPKEMKRVLPLFITVGKEGEADLGKVAMMIDRFLSLTEGFQIYGSQAQRIIKKGQAYQDTKLELFPIADEENMRRRREALGMIDFNLNCQRLKVEYIEIKDRPNYQPLPLKKKWIRKGYLLVK